MDAVAQRKSLSISKIEPVLLSLQPSAADAATLCELKAEEQLYVQSFSHYYRTF